MFDKENPNFSHLRRWYQNMFFLEEGIVTNTFEQYVFSKTEHCKAVQFFRVELHIYNCINRSIKHQMHSQNIFRLLLGQNK